MDLSSWQIMLRVSLILSIIFFILTVVLIIKFKIFSIIRFNYSNRRLNKINTSQTLTASELSVTEHITEHIQTQPSKSGTVTCNFQHINSSGTVVVGQPNNGTGTVVCSDRFEITKNIVVIHADPGIIK